MNILDDDMTAKLVQDAQRMREAAKDVMEQKVATTGARLRSDVKTRKSAATREKIMEAATQIMVERGSTDFQMSEVSARCKLSKGSLYYYFEDKSALIRAIFDRAVDELVDEVESVVAKAPSAKDSIVGLMQALANGLQPGSPLALAMTHRSSSATNELLSATESRVTRITSILSAQFERAKGEGLVRPDVNTRLGAATIAGAFMAYEYVLPASKSEGDMGELVNELIDLVFSGIGTERSREVFSAEFSKAAENGQDPRKDA